MVVVSTPALMTRQHTRSVTSETAAANAPVDFRRPVVATPTSTAAAANQTSAIATFTGRSVWHAAWRKAPIGRSDRSCRCPLALMPMSLRDYRLFSDDADRDYPRRLGRPVTRGSVGSWIQMRVGMGMLATLALTCLAGCGSNRDDTAVRPTAPECSDAGHRHADALAVTLGAPSATAHEFDLCLTRWDTPSLFGQLVGVRIDPFVAGGDLRQAESVLARRYDCDKPVDVPNFGRGDAATINCTIGNVPSHVFLLREDHFAQKPVKDPSRLRVSANFYPRT